MKQRFKHAIVRKPGKSMVNGLTDANLGVPDYELASTQHAKYVEALLSCGVDVKILDADEKYPDSCFVEDVALCTPHCAIITRPGAVSRRGETIAMKKVLENFYQNIEVISVPGTLDAGDVMMVKEHYYIGLSDRTNKKGASQLISFLKKYGMSGSTLKLEKVLHLKTGVAYLENENMLVGGEFVSAPRFQQYNLLEISPHEAYSANSIWVNGKVVIPSGYPVTKLMISKLGYPVIEVDMSEFQKLDGGVSCLSLRF